MILLCSIAIPALLGLAVWLWYDHQRYKARRAVECLLKAQGDLSTERYESAEDCARGALLTSLKIWPRFVRQGLLEDATEFWQDKIAEREAFEEEVKRVVRLRS